MKYIKIWQEVTLHKGVKEAYYLVVEASLICVAHILGEV